ncbi:hypothetical protein KEU06_15515 [Pseudaminobacter sp. 19-2017]|uniref:Uncharacterized protein n=1 Tax=Pseudaminobacter soli (ex Zhang et al. 2022) TaxID=2831468 RepID=A0A942E2W6_9HYPH|nr:hypothetical protein [Pseudaminobacter soli]MBS3650021.1 hypothetical protein [Pseudaminobacter soli]
MVSFNKIIGFRELVYQKEFQLFGELGIDTYRKGDNFEGLMEEAVGILEDEFQFSADPFFIKRAEQLITKMESPPDMETFDELDRLRHTIDRLEDIVSSAIWTAHERRMRQKDVDERINNYVESRDDI